jgi:transcriptional regulator with XRE-family HTH domain
MIMKDEIKKLRLELGFTQLELAFKLDVTPYAISLWERGKNTPGIKSIRMLKELAESSGIQWKPE